MLRGLGHQMAGRHAEAVDAFQRSIYSITDGYTRTNLLMARSLVALRRPAEAISVLRPAIHGGVDGNNSYVSRTELHEAMAQAFERAGQRDSAVAQNLRSLSPACVTRTGRRGTRGRGSGSTGTGGFRCRPPAPPRQGPTVLDLPPGASAEYRAMSP